jgi:hypothetical protein
MDLKPYYDKAMAAEAEVQRMAGEIDALIQEHDAATDEAVKAEKMQAALAKRPELDAAKAKAVEANQLYVSMRNASQESGLPKKFVPANPDAQTDAQPEGKKMSRADFEALSAGERMNFTKAGGKVIEGKETEEA